MFRFSTRVYRVVKNSSRGYSTASGINEVVIVSAVRTPVGCFNGSLKKLSAPELGAIATKGALEKTRLKPEQIEEIYFGNVLQANIGQSPARQVAIKAGLPTSTEATTINKVCASGMKAVILAAQSLSLGDRSIMVAGGMESMSNTPYYVPRNAIYGNQTMTDGIIKDGLWDVYNQIHMGNCAENTAKKFNISRESQDEHAIESYKRAAEAWKNGVFKEEVVPVVINERGKDVVINEDEEYKNVKFDKIKSLKPVFQKDGTVTAANSSTLNDGASALILTTKLKADEIGLKPLARIISYGDAAVDPIDFTIAPSQALPVALKKARLSISDISLFEFNEAFSVVARANEQILGLDPSKVNIAGGAVSLGHPIGSSGSRILVTLLHLLKPHQLGAAAICNGGGAASSIIIERL
ncbi:Thiolase, N-terminal domain-containing protein [Glomus cerebriforme]|uniref:acetyl-CoA C-acetyltransferase n=1 Tax=Glomus cerebriforme TaxID=658196 RepID=A0A397TL54_9GLOM|nr:Thiolase, N-terminal domain-containing protein [Glomus cerebriforme]